MVTLREKARQAGAQWYKSDSTCIHGHKNPVRYTMTGGCKPCIRIREGGTENPEWYSLAPHYKPKKVKTINLTDDMDNKWIDLPLNEYLDKMPKTVKAVKKARKRTTTVCTCNSNDYRRTFKKWIKDKVAAW